MSHLGRFIAIAVLLSRPSLVSTQAPADASASFAEAFRLFRAGRFEEARDPARRAVELRDAAHSATSAAMVESLLLLGRILDLRADHSAAEGVFVRARAIAESLPEADALVAAEAIDRLARHDLIRARYAEADALAKRALAMRETRVAPADRAVAESWGTLADCAQSTGDVRQAVAAAERSLEIASKAIGPDDLDYGDYLVRAGRAASGAGDYARGAELFSQAQALADRLAGPDSYAAGAALAGLASLALARNDNVKAEQLHRRAVAIYERWSGPDHYNVANLFNNLGLIFYRRGDYPNAEAMHLRAMRIRERSLGPSHPSVGSSLNNLGLVYSRQRDYPKAKEYFERTLAFMEAAHGADSVAVTAALGNLGIVAKETGDYAGGEAYYRRALAIKEKALGSHHPDLTVLIESLGILYRDHGDYAKAEPMLLRALAITEETIGPVNAVVTRQMHNLGRLYAAMGDVPKALASWQREAAGEEEALPVNLALGSERQKLAYFRPFMTALDRMIAFHVQDAGTSAGARDLAATTLLQRKGRVLDAMANSLIALRDRAEGDLEDLVGRLDRVTSQLASYVLGDTSRAPLAERLRRAKALRDQRDAIENELSRRTAGYVEPSRSITLAEIQRAVPADAALVEFAVYHAVDAKGESEGTAGEARYVVYVLRPSRPVGWADLGPAQGIDEAVAALRTALSDPKDTRARRAGRSLAAKAFDPIVPLIDGAAHLLISPDGALNLVPFEALTDAADRYLVERFAITYLTTGRDLLRMQIPRPSRSAAAIFADPAFGDPSPPAGAATNHAVRLSTARAPRSITIGTDRAGMYFAPLLGTAAEARTIKSLFPDARVLVGARASERALKQIEAPDILHVATHGFFLRESAAGATTSAGGTAPGDGSIENPLLRSGLALAGANRTGAAGDDDGILTALEAAHLNLWGTRLVTLSACDTGVGEVRTGEGVYGLRRAFFIAGAESIVMSLWPVGDYATRETMADYYARLRKGVGRGAALRQTQLAMLKRPGRRHPYFWAGFILAGEWAGLDGRR